MSRCAKLVPVFLLILAGVTYFVRLGLGLGVEVGLNPWGEIENLLQDNDLGEFKDLFKAKGTYFRINLQSFSSKHSVNKLYFGYIFVDEGCGVFI